MKMDGWHDGYLSGMMWRRLAGWGRFPPLGWWRGVCSCAIAVAIAVLTLIDFTQAARVAERADHPWLPTASALHPTLCRPRSHATLPEMQRCPELLHNPKEGGTEAATFLIQHCSVHTYTHTHTYGTYRHNDKGRHSLLQLPSPLLHCPLFFWKHTHSANTHTHIHKALHIYNSAPHASLSAVQIGKEGGREWLSGAERR